MSRTCTVCLHPKRDNIETDLRAGTSYRDIVRRHTCLKMPFRDIARITCLATGLAAAREIMAILNRAETAVTWNLTVLTIREARRYVEELMMLNLTVPGSRAAAPDANAK